MHFLMGGGRKRKVTFGRKEVRGVGVGGSIVPLGHRKQGGGGNVNSVCM